MEVEWAETESETEGQESPVLQLHAAAIVAAAVVVAVGVGPVASVAAMFGAEVGGKPVGGMAGTADRVLVADLIVG